MSSWKQWFGRWRGEGAGNFRGGALLLSIPPPATPSTGRSFWSRLKGKPSETSPIVTAPSPTQQLVDNVSRLCGLLERQLADDPSRPWREAAEAQCEQLRQLTGVLSGMPAALRMNNESLSTQQKKLEEIVGHLSASMQQQAEAGRQIQAMHRAQQETAAAMQAVTHTVEQQSARTESQSLTLSQVLGEARARQDEMARAMQQQSRRATLMTGFTIGLAAASAVFGAIGLYLKLVGG